MEKPSPFSSEKHRFSSHPENSNNKPIKAKNISILVVVVSLPILYASVLHIPPSTLLKDTTFWFLMSNSIILFITIDIGVIFAPSHDLCEKKLYEDFVAYSKPQSVYFMEEPPNTIDNSLVAKKTLIDDSNRSIDENKASSSDPMKSGAKDAYHEEVPSTKEVDKAIVLVENSNRKKVSKAKSLDQIGFNERSIVTTEKPLRRSKTQEKRSSCNNSESHDYEKLSDEELNRRVEEFIRRYYREMRLQLNNESVYI
jgi:Cotton fibre expressed protein